MTHALFCSAIERRIFAGALAALFILVVLYAYAIVMTVVHIGTVESIGQETRSIRAEIGVLEARYLEQTAILSEETAIAYGLTRPGEEHVVRLPTGGRVSALR